MQTGGGVAQARGAGGDGCGGEAAEGLPGRFETAAGEGQAKRRVMALEARGERDEAVGGRAEAAGGGEVEPAAEVVEALGAAADEGLQPVLDLGDGDG